MLSIIIPTHNSEATIKRCIYSILSIKNINYEIIIIDDGSSDNTLAINNEFSKKYPNIYSFKQTNQGVSSARNTGLKYCNGQWICFIDSDDSINSEKLEEIYNSYTSSNNDLIVSNILFNNKNLGLHNSTYKQFTINSFLKINYPVYGNELLHVIWNKLYKSSIIYKYHITFPKSITIGEDLIFNINYFLHIRNNIIQTSIIYYNYQINSNSVTHNFDKNAFNNRIAIIKSLNKLYSKYNLLDAHNYILIKSIYSLLLNILNKKKNVLKSLKHEKFKIQHYSLLNDFHKKNNYKQKESHILLSIFKQPSIYLLYFSLKLINILRIL